MTTTFPNLSVPATLPGIIPSACGCLDAQGTVSLESNRFPHSKLDALSAHIAILDDHGTIIEVNAAWIRFASENDFNNGHNGLGNDYLKTCDSACGSFSDEASVMAEGIRAVMTGQRQEFHLEYPCHSPEAQRWFLARATRFTGDGSIRVVVAHENITECKQAQDALRWKAGLLAALPIGKMQDVLLARFVGRDEATKMNFSSAVLSRVATAISEVTCNVVQHAGCAGMFLIGQIAEGDRRGLRIIVSDKGKGIEHPERFLEDGKAGTLGSGLPGTRRLVDRFQIESAPGMGTTVTMEFWNGEVTI